LFGDPLQGEFSVERVTGKRYGPRVGGEFSLERVTEKRA